MRFRIDVVFLDRNLQVVKVEENLRRWRTASARHARAALELPAGEAAARGVEVGDRLELLVGTAVPLATAAGPTGRNACAGDKGRSHRQDDPLKSTGGGADSTHVFLVGNDRRFRSVTSALLARRGCTVTLVERLDVAALRASREGAEVVVIDADSSPGLAARKAVEIQMLEPPVGVVLVGDERSGSAISRQMLAKWGPFDELYGAIVTARPDRDRSLPNGGR